MALLRSTEQLTLLSMVVPGCSCDDECEWKTCMHTYMHGTHACTPSKGGDKAGRLAGSQVLTTEAGSQQSKTATSMLKRRCHVQFQACCKPCWLCAASLLFSDRKTQVCSLNDLLALPAAAVCSRAGPWHSSLHSDAALYIL